MAAGPSPVQRENDHRVADTMKTILKVTAITLGIFIAAAAIVTAAVFCPELVIVPIVIVIGTAAIIGGVYGHYYYVPAPCPAYRPVVVPRPICFPHHHPHHRYHHHGWW
jgi:hypothetical protein